MISTSSSKGDRERERERDCTHAVTSVLKDDLFKSSLAAGRRRLLQIPPRKQRAARTNDGDYRAPGKSMYIFLAKQDPGRARQNS